MLVEPWLVRAAAVQPARAAVETPDGSWSYAELLARAQIGAAALARRGAAPGERVAIALAPGLAFAQALHSCLLIGAVAVPVDLRLGAREREAVCAGAGVVVEEPLGDGPAGAPLVPRGHDLGAPAAIVHTSGTTSAPRPVSLTYGNFLWSALGSAVALGLDLSERWLCALPLAHVGGLSILLRSAIYATTAVVHERFEDDRVMRALRGESITLVSVVPTTLTRLLEAGLASPPTLRCALTGGGPLPPALRERAAASGVPVSETYGLTEACSQATTTPVGAVGDARGGAGPPLFCTRARVAEDGEILIAGPTVAPAAPAPDGWLHTGDLGWRDAAGNLHVSGRRADTIITGGENVAPTEVEAVLESHPDVAEAAVVGRSDPEWGEAVTAIVVVRLGAQTDAERLRAHCAGRLAPFKVPKRVVLDPGPLPRTRSGKLLRRELE
jgi:O-succinylbenzoic acid--CoA ligase